VQQPFQWSTFPTGRRWPITCVHALIQELGLTNVYTAQLFYHQQQLQPGTSAALQAAVPALTEEDLSDMQRAPVRRFDPDLLQVRRRLPLRAMGRTHVRRGTGPACGWASPFRPMCELRASGRHSWKLWRRCR